MTRLRQLMLEELQRRNYAPTTIRCYLRTVTHFSRYFNRPPDQLGPEHIRQYQAALFTRWKLHPNSVTQRLAALRFFFVQTLHRSCSVAETPYPKKRFQLPTVLSQTEVAKLIAAAATPFHRILLMTLYATGVRRAELVNLKLSDIDSQRMVIHVRGGKGRKDRDVMLSPVLLAALRQYWRSLKRKPTQWLFPGKRWQGADTPITGTAIYHACEAAAGGLSPDQRHWIPSHSRFFLSVKVLSRVFRGKLVALLQRACSRHQPNFYGRLSGLAQPKPFAAFLRTLFRHNWVVYCKPPFGGPEPVLNYLGAYTHRIAISDHRLLSVDSKRVTLRWRDRTQGNRKRRLTLPLHEFLCRFLLHVLPYQFVRIRHYGFLSSRHCATLWPVCAHLLTRASTPLPAVPAAPFPKPRWPCPHCGVPMHLVERLSARQIQLRSPPELAARKAG